MNAADLSKQGRAFMARADEADTQLRARIEEVAEAERLYRKARALAWPRVPQATAKEKEDWVDAETADERFTRDLADGMRRADLELVKRRTTEITLLMAVAASHRSEAELAR